MFGRDEKVSGSRLTAVQYIILVVFLVLAYGLWRLQVVQSEFYAALAEKNKTREVPILAPRGKILDREGRTIVDNYPSFTALLLRDSTRDLSGDADLIAQGLHLDPKEVRDRLKKFSGTAQYQPIYLKEDITPDELAFIESHRNELPELDTIMAHRRLYPKNGFMAHLVGYVGEVSEQMLNQARWELYNPGDVVGRSGVELEYNPMLMGKNGSRQSGSWMKSRPCPENSSSSPLILICRLPRNRPSMDGMAPLWRWIPGPAKSWPWSAVLPTIPIISRCESPTMSG